MFFNYLNQHCKCTLGILVSNFVLYLYLKFICSTIHNKKKLRYTTKKNITFHIYGATKKRNGTLMNVFAYDITTTIHIILFRSTYVRIFKYTYIMICLCFDILICCFIPIVTLTSTINNRFYAR